MNEPIQYGESGRSNNSYASGEGNPKPNNNVGNLREQRVKK